MNTTSSLASLRDFAIGETAVGEDLKVSVATGQKSFPELTAKGHTTSLLEPAPPVKAPSFAYRDPERRLKKEQKYSRFNL